jgi:predicted acylesterase/phospholipase RssA
MKALILSGGGARGAYEAGVVDALVGRETFDIICGTSIGALNGMLVAQGMGGRLADLWLTLPGRKVAQLRPELAGIMRLWDGLHGIARAPLFTKPRHALATLASIPELRIARRLRELRGLLDSAHVRAIVTEIADLAAVRHTFILGVTNLSTARGNAFAYFPPPLQAGSEAFFFAEHDAQSITNANYVDAVCASAALPPAFEPVAIRCADGRTRIFADGGFTNNAPLRQAIDAGATEVTAIFVDPLAPCDVDHQVDTMAHIASLMLEANTNRMLELDLKLTAHINDDVMEGNAPGKRFVNIRIIRPQEPLALPLLNFEDGAEIRKLLELGRRDGERASLAVTPPAAATGS